MQNRADFRSFSPHFIGFNRWVVLEDGAARRDASPRGLPAPA